MLGKNNYQERQQNMSKQEHFVIRKLSIGAMSILLSFAFLANCQTVKADAIIPSNDQKNEVDKTKLTTYSALNSFLKSHDEAKTSKTNLVKKSAKVPANSRKQKQDGPAPATKENSDDKWNNISVSYNEDTRELTLLGGTEDAPAIMHDSFNLEPLCYFLQAISGDFNSRHTLEKIIIQGKIKAQGIADHLFWNLDGLKSIEGLPNLDTSDVTSMDGMFDSCNSLTNLDVSHFNTSKVTDMVDMFHDCQSLTNLDSSNFDTANLTSMEGMFSGCQKLINLNVANFNTSKVTDMVDMFKDCQSLTDLDLSNFNTSKVTNMQNMFSGCAKLIALDLSHFDTSKVTIMDGMFENCHSLNNLNLSGFKTSQVTSMNNMFKGSYSLNDLNLSSFDTSQVTNMGNMFATCYGLNNLNLSSFDTSKVTYMPDMFDDCPNLLRLTLGKKFKFPHEVWQKTQLEKLSGKWINLGTANKQLPMGTELWSSEEFVRNYNGASDYDAYIRFPNFGGPITVQYRDRSGKEIPYAAAKSQFGNVGNSLIDKTNPDSVLSFKRKDIPGYSYDRAEINGQKVDLADVRYTKDPQTVTLFYTKMYFDNNDENNSSGPISIDVPVESAKNVTLIHNAYLYDGNGKRANRFILKAGTVIATYGIETINGRKFYILVNKDNNNESYYVAVGNAKPTRRKLHHNAYIYNEHGMRYSKKVLKKGKLVKTYGSPVTIKHKKYYITARNKFVKKANFR